MQKRYLILVLSALLGLTACHRQSVQGSYATPDKQAQGIALGLTASSILGPFPGATTIGSAASGGFVGNMMGATTARHSLMNTLARHGVQVIAQGDFLRIILPTDRFFHPGTPTLNPHEYPVMDYVAALLKEYGRTPITIAGYTDTIASPAQARKLSQQQAESVLGYLWVHGVEYSHLKAIGEGAKHPIADNNTVHGSAVNRRIEITLRADC